MKRLQHFISVLKPMFRFAFERFDEKWSYRIREHAKLLIYFGAITTGEKRVKEEGLL